MHVGDKAKIYPIKPFSGEPDMFHPHHGKTGTILSVDRIPVIDRTNYYVSLDDFPDVNQPEMNRFYYRENLSPSPVPDDLSCITSKCPKELSFDAELSEEQTTKLIRIIVNPAYRRSNNWLKMHKYPMRRKGIDIYDEIENFRKPVTHVTGR